ncbi:MAG: hypothetical protein GXO47_05715 [Chlorobi bacterium]|nr:hypothetical protein [Chlorobiota bacterium]
MNTKNKYIELLNRQLEKLEEPNFELSAWKRSTILILSSIFGENNFRTRSIETIEYEYSSWSLRDESGNKDPVKAICKETLQTIISEIELSDNFSEKPSNNTNLHFIWEAFENALTGAKSKELKRTLTEEQNEELKKTETDLILQKLPDDTKKNILKQILLSGELKDWLLNH